jgi:hypothetical protein
MTSECGVAELLRAGGPVRAPLRACCAAALVGRKAQPCGAASEAPEPEVVLEADGVLDASGVGT